MNTPSAPAAPDPSATAAAQSASNKATATTQAQLNMIDQNTPQGSLKYSQTGTYADGTPKFEATQSYSAPEQSIYDTGTQTRQNLADIGSTQSAKIGQLLNTPYSLGTATSDKISGIQKQFLDPQWQQQQQQLETQLINKGIMPGSEQYQREQRDFSTNRQRAYDQSYLDAYSTGEKSALTERNQPINEISALLSGSQVSQPSYTNTPNTGVAPTDVIGAQQQSLNQQNVGYQGQLAQNQGLMSGLFGLGSAGLGGWAYGGFKGSDRRTKEDITRVGKTDSGLPIYTYRYKGGGLMEMGLMADEVEKKIPEAVAHTPEGLLAVDYGQIAENG